MQTPLTSQPRIQARITLPPAIREPIDVLRAKWNPVRAINNPAHITIAYHDEATNAELLVERLDTIAIETAPFTLILGSVERWPHPINGAFLTADDPTHAIDAVRRRLLAPPFTTRTRFGLHVTLLHPDHGEQLNDAWPELARCEVHGAFTVTQFEIVGSMNETLMAIPLG